MKVKCMKKYEKDMTFMKKYMELDESEITELQKTFPKILGLKPSCFLIIILFSLKNL